MMLALAITMAVSGLGMVGTIGAVENNEIPLTVLGGAVKPSREGDPRSVFCLIRAGDLLHFYKRALELAEIDVEDTENLDDNAGVKINAIKFRDTVSDLKDHLDRRIEEYLPRIKLDHTYRYADILTTFDPKDYNGLDMSTLYESVEKYKPEGGSSDFLKSVYSSNEKITNDVDIPLGKIKTWQDKHLDGVREELTNHIQDYGNKLYDAIGKNIEEKKQPAENIDTSEQSQEP